MKSYEFSRRSFFRATGSALGLHTLLRSVVAHAEGMSSPARFLVTHHPVGTVRPAWLCTGSGSNYTISRILKPFETAMLRQDMIILDGLDMDSIEGPGGGHEKGTVIAMTGAPTHFTRTGQTETDDPMAGGPSLDQLLLAKSAMLQGAPINSLQALCDDRIDYQEIGPRCLSYSLDTRKVAAVQTNDGQENIPIRPTLKPLDLYNRVFGTMMPGGATDQNVAALQRARAAKKSVLDFSLRELTRLQKLAPASQSATIEAHAKAIRDMEKELDGQVKDAPSCGLSSAPPDVSAVADDGKDHNNYADPTTTKADDTLHAQLGQYHQAIIRAAFQCDLTRVATFQWSPGTNHIAFKGLHPDSANGIYMHHPVSHRVGASDILEPDPAKRKSDVEFLIQVEIWYNTRMAEFFNTLKSSTDMFGNSVFDHTVIPYISEVSQATHEHNPMPVLIFGGKSLGMKGGQFLSFKGRPYNDMWLAVAKAFGVTVADLQGTPMLSAPYTTMLEGVVA